MTKKKIEVPQNDKQKAQELLLLYQLLQKNIELLSQQLSMAEKSLLEIEVSEHAVHDFEQLAENTEMIVPLGSNCFAYGKSTEKKKLLVGVGANLVVSKDAKETLAFLAARKAEIEKVRTKLETEIKHSLDKINELTPQLQQFIKG